MSDDYDRTVVTIEDTTYDLTHVPADSEIQIWLDGNLVGFIGVHGPQFRLLDAGRDHIAYEPQTTEKTAAHGTLARRLHERLNGI